jgi:purine nucleosidase
LFDARPPEKLPAATRAGKLLRGTLPYLYRSFRQQLGVESIVLPDAVGIAALLHPELFRTEDLSGDVETTGELTTGVTVFDRRSNASHRTDMEVALEIDAAGVADTIVRGLTDAGRQT